MSDATAEGRQDLYGLMAEFEDPESLLEGVRQAHQMGYRHMDAYTPFPVEGVREALGFRSTRLLWTVIGAGLLGAAAGYLLQYYTSVIDYPLNVGGRPLNSWPAFIPITFEVAILMASFAAVFGMLALNGLPQPYHPVFNVDRFEAASRDGFFLCIEARDPLFDPKATRAFLGSLPTRGIYDVPA